MRRKKNSWAKRRIIGTTNNRLLLPLHRSIRFLTTSPSLLPTTATGRHHLPLLSPRLHQLLPPTTLAFLSPLSRSQIHNVGPSSSFAWRCPSSIRVIDTVDSSNNICLRTQGRCLYHWCCCGSCRSRWHILLVAVGGSWQGGQAKEGPTEGC